MRKLLFLFLVLMCGCTSIDCPVQTLVRTYYSLHKADESTDTLKDTLYIVSFRTDGTDTLLLNALIGQTSFSLPIGYANPEDTLYFVFRNSPFYAVDTVLLKKENLPHFESVDCSATFFHNITAIRSTHHAIDSISINNPSVTYDADTENFFLYLKSHD